jgi:hypothetical protein
MNDPARSYERIEPADLLRVADIAKMDREAFFLRNARYAELRNRVLAVALCQGAALHYVDGVNGIKDIDVWTFYVSDGGVEYPPRRPVANYDFGNPKFGKTRDFEHFRGRKVDCLGRSIPAQDKSNPVAALRSYLASAYTDSAARLAQKAVVLIEPREHLGTIIWRASSTQSNNQKPRKG